MSMGSIVAPFVAGLCIQHGQLTLWAWVAAALALVGALLKPRQERGAAT
jgi:hypothetical protein